MADYQTEGNYIVAENEAGELYIYITARGGKTDHPYIVYDGKDHAILARNAEQAVVLDYINPDVRDKLRKAAVVIVVETLLDNIKDAYIADMNIVSQMPDDLQKLGLKTWEDLSLKR